MDSAYMSHLPSLCQCSHTDILTTCLGLKYLSSHHRVMESLLWVGASRGPNSLLEGGAVLFRP